MRPSPEEDALRQELAAAQKTARKKARLLQRPLTFLSDVPEPGPTC
jgi:hypothetical protein